MTTEATLGNVPLSDGLGPNAPTPYQQRAIDQGRQWVVGESHHNPVDDECCPDFSCCEPRLFERCPAKRLSEFNRWARGYGFAEIENALSPEFRQAQADEAPRLAHGA